MNAIYCKNCHEILYSYAQRHFNECSCGNCYIDTEGIRVGFKDKSKLVELELNTDFLFKNLILQHDNIDFSKMGKFIIKPTSNEKFYKQAIVNWEEFESHFKQVVTKSKLDMFIEAKEKGLVQK